MPNTVGWIEADLMWLNLEVGTARSLNRLTRTQIDVPRHSDPRWRGRRALVVETAHTYLPEAVIDSLPEVARYEVNAGLSGERSCLGAVV